MLRTRIVKDVVLRRVRAGRPGPDEHELNTGRSWFWGEVADGRGKTATARGHGPNGYLLTAHAALLVLQRVLDGSAPAGFQTPSLAYGADLMLAVPGVHREDV
jgi:saccharopine dehydrogenase (NAD+, L-lysine-forming)